MTDLQSFVLKEKPSRRELLAYSPVSEREVRIAVYRNHSFELVEHTIGAYLDFAGLKAVFSYSDYDDSLTFLSLDKKADLLILWLDLGRYKQTDVSAFIGARISELKKTFKKPILIVPVDGTIAIADESVVIADLSPLLSSFGDIFFDERMEAASGTRVSARALLAVSKELGLRYIPACVLPALKAIVVDLDNTLYRGVLGEDGVDGIELTEGHRRLQALLKEKASQGWFLCAASKNDPSDVEEMFAKRSDFIVRKEDFTEIRASWNDKSEEMTAILKRLNIGVDSVLFIDDNPGEIAQMQARFPTVHTLIADPDGDVTANALAYYPRLLKTGVKKEDALRSADVQANEEREKLKSSLSQTDYIRSLGIELCFYVDDPQYAPRISELANKTNQFIFTYKRYAIEEVLDLMRNENAAVISATLADRLSDSGTIAVCVGVKDGDALRLEECFVSCRALGRGIDDVLILGMIETAAETLGVKKLQVSFRKGERNLPAERFVTQYLQKYVDKPNDIDFVTDTSLVKLTVRRR